MKIPDLETTRVIIAIMFDSGLFTHLTPDQWNNIMAGKDRGDFYINVSRSEYVVMRNCWYYKKHIEALTDEGEFVDRIKEFNSR